jgi:hypothetical protein
MGFFLFATASSPALEPIRPPMQRGPGDLFAGVKWSGREANYSPPSSAEVRNMWSYTTISTYVFMAWCLVKHGVNKVP